jgi:hypothetical protein
MFYVSANVQDCHGIQYFAQWQMAATDGDAAMAVTRRFCKDNSLTVLTWIRCNTFKPELQGK